MKFQKQGHVWLRRLSLSAAGCVVGASLLPWGFASDDEPKQKKKAKSNAETKVESNLQLGSSSSAGSVNVTSVFIAGEPIGESFSVSAGNGSVSSSSSSSGTGRSSGSGSSSSASSSPGQKNQESVSKTINTVDGKRTMTVVVTTNSRTVLIHQDAKGTFRVEVQDNTEGNQEKRSFVADSRKEFAKVHPEVFESIKAYLQDRPPVAPVAPAAPVASINLKQAVVAGAQSPVAIAGFPLNPLQSSAVAKVEGKPLSRAVAGVALAPSVPSVSSASAIASVPAAPSVPAISSVPAIPSVPAVPSIPSEPREPALPALEGVLEALDKIRSESAGNLEIEKLIESIKAKLDEKS